MTAHPVTSRIRDFLIGHFPSARTQPLGEDDHLLANGVLDSLGILDLVAYLEREFAIMISDDDLLPENFESLRRLTSFVEERRAVGSREA
jgi:acyl carrier protein